MSDVSEPQSAAEQLDADKLPGDQDDPTAGGAYPPDRPLAVDDYGTTPAEERTPEPLDEWVEREMPEDSTAADDPLAPENSPAVSAEEAAMHLTDPPPMGEPGDGYIDPEESSNAGR